MQAFDPAHAADLFVAGAHRGANDADEDAQEPANPTTDDGSVFHRVHQQVVAGPGDGVVQVLGTSGGVRLFAPTASRTGGVHRDELGSTDPAVLFVSAAGLTRLLGVGTELDVTVVA